MPAAANILATLHLILQISFIGVTLLLLVVTLMNRMRVRHVLLSWRRGYLLGLPVWPSVFLAALLTFCISSFMVKHVLPLELVAGYLLGGLFWFIASLLSGTMLVTEYGLIYHSNEADQAIAWGQVVDYFKVSEATLRYVFFYRGTTGTCERFELPVPRAQEAVFGRIVESKLDARFEPDTQHVAIGK